MKTKIIKNIQIVETRHAASLLAALLLCPIVLPAQNGVTVSNLAVNAGTVTFEVGWGKNTIPSTVKLWSDTVWVFVDYNNAGKMERLPLLPGATLTATSPGGKVIEETGNNKGVWVAGNAKALSSGSFSATVKLLFSAATNVAGACAYASNYQPVGEYTSPTNISFKGTSPFIITLKEVGGIATITQTSDGNFLMPGGYEYVSFSDKTGAPGVMKCIPMAGNIDFSVPVVSKEQPVSFSVTANPSTPDVSKVTYTWSAPDFTPATGSGTLFSTTAPAALGSYPVTLTAHSASYCDLSRMKQVTVVDCHGGRLGAGTVCSGNDGGKIGYTN